MSDEYEVYAIKYARHNRPAHENFLGGDFHDDNMPLDYFVWAIVGETRTFVVDMGFDAEKGRKRGRTMIKPPEAGLKALGVDPDSVEDVIVTHMHYDHAGNTTSFPNARFHLQDREMSYCTGRCMCHTALSQVFEADDVTAMIRRVFEGRVEFHDGSSMVAPGISVHLVGGHSNGLQAVRVRTRRGWVVLASDASHLYANMDQRRPFPVVYNVGDMIEGWKTIEKLADSPDHIIPGHDPAVLQNFPAANPGLEDWIVRLDADPVRTRRT
jgi:glyoxylase-like metal-dependent hydrolase (beta-lactamase superfamily II)